MFRTPDEIKIASLRYIEGCKQDQIASAVGMTQARVSQLLSTFNRCFRQLGLDPNHPEEIREAVIVIIRRTSQAA